MLICHLLSHLLWAENHGVVYYIVYSMIHSYKLCLNMIQRFAKVVSLSNDDDLVPGVFCNIPGQEILWLCNTNLQ